MPAIPTRMGTTAAAPALALLVAVAGLGFGCGYGSLDRWDEDGQPREAEDDGTTPGDRVDFDRAPRESGVEHTCRGTDAPNAASAPARLMTSYEYANTVRDLVGYRGSITDEFPAENEVSGFENNVGAHRASRLLVRKYQKAAETIAEETVSSRLDELLPCEPSASSESACGTAFVEDFLERAFRRPPTDDELRRFESLFEEGRANWDFETGIELVVRAALQAPQFLYRLRFVDGVEPGETDKLDSWDVAERLSYFLWASAPDDELMAAARRGELRTPEQVARQVRRMLDDPRARQAVYQFHRQWLGLDGLASMTKDGDRYPAYDEGMNPDWRASMRRFVNDVYFSDELGTAADLLDSTTVYLTASLAELYDRSPKSSEGLEAYRFDEERRSGLLTQPALMALLANANQRSPIRRGVWVREQLLCQELSAPPPDANTTPPDPDPDATTRERFRQHTEDPECASCHQKIDPVGFGFENYDALGRWREQENGKPIDASGELTDTHDPSIEGPFEGADELAERLQNSEQVERCLASRWFTFALGRRATGRETCALRQIQSAFVESGGNFEELLVELATSEAFLYRQLPSEDSSP